MSAARKANSGKTLARNPGDVRIGLSGWSYAPWAGQFYPDGLPARRWLAYAASHFPAMEVNASFYRMQSPNTYAKWAEQVPKSALLAVKGSRFITHIRRLRDIEIPLANFFASGVLALGNKLGPLLWQFPATFQRDDRMEAFLDLLPKDTEEAARLAAGHDARLAGRALTETDAKRPLRHAVEIRNESFLDPAFVAMLRARNMALVVADTVDWPCRMDLTADFIYCRLHGSSELYRSRYAPQALDRWAARVACWRDGRPMSDGTFIAEPQGPDRPRDVFVFFDNTDKLHAPEDAQALMARLGIARPVAERDEPTARPTKAPSKRQAGKKAEGRAGASA